LWQRHPVAIQSALQATPGVLQSLGREVNLKMAK
jgi:hypothetical protein